MNHIDPSHVVTPQEEVVRDFTAFLMSGNKTNQRNALRNLLLLRGENKVEDASFATLCEKVLRTPFEVDKIRLFVQNSDGQKLLSGVRDCFP